MGVVVVPLLHLPQHLGVGLGRTPLLQLQLPALCPHLHVGVEENFHVRVGQHHRADIPAVHDDAVLPRQRALHLHQEVPHTLDGGDGGGVHGYLRQADVRRHILPVQQHALQAVAVVLHGDVDVRQRGQHRRRVLGVDAPSLHIQTDGAVNGAGVHIQDAQPLRRRLGQCALARAGGPVYGHGVSSFVHMLHPRCSAAERPARYPVAHAIWRLNPPV